MQGNCTLVKRMVEAYEQMKNGNALRFIKDYWFIVSTLVVLTVGGSMLWADAEARIRANEIVNSKQSEEIQMLEDDLSVLDKRYIEDITFIKAKLETFIGTTR